MVICIFFRRNSTISNLIDAYGVYMDCQTKSKESIEFYEKLMKLLQELETAVATREAEYEVEMEKNEAAGPALTSMINKPARPSLRDFMAYYRAKKAGQAAAFPSTGAKSSLLTMPASGPCSMHGANVSYQASPMNGSQETFSMDGDHSMNGFNSAATGTFSSAVVNGTFPSTSDSGHSSLGSYSDTGTTGAHSTLGASMPQQPVATTIPSSDPVTMGNVQPATLGSASAVPRANPTARGHSAIYL